MLRASAVVFEAQARMGALDSINLPTVESRKACGRLEPVMPTSIHSMSQTVAKQAENDYRHLTVTTAAQTP